MKVTVLLRVPFLDRIPSLKTLIVCLAEKGVEIRIISSRDDSHTVPDFGKYPNVKMTFVKRRSRSFGIPTAVKLFFPVLRSILFCKSDYYVGGDSVANSILYRLRKLFRFGYVNFVLEYPDISDRKELRGIEAADYVITHDRWHGDFLGKYCSIDRNRMLFLPNASYTDVHREHSSYLSGKFGISPDKTVVLHSGGFGSWFCSRELALSAAEWDSRYVLVFHTGFSVADDPYFLDVEKELTDNGRLRFSTAPVSNLELDEMISSAEIGIATYSVEVLGYRAENMGLAAGKIGNYLKCGIPVVATKVDSLSYLEEYHCGVLVENVGGIQKAMAVIMSDYDRYREGAYRCYTELWHPKKYCDAIYGTLNGAAV